MAVTNWTASMIKAWLGADYLRRATEQHRAPSDSILSTIEIMIRERNHSDESQIFGEVTLLDPVKGHLSPKSTVIKLEQVLVGVTRENKRSLADPDGRRESG